MFAPFGSILRLFAVLPWPIWDAEGPNKDPFGGTEKEGPNQDPFG